MSDITQKINPVSNRSGSRNNLSFAMLDSRIATPTISVVAFTMTSMNGKSNEERLAVVESPQGKNKLTPSIIKKINLFALAHSISASLLPEYSKIIAS